MTVLSALLFSFICAAGIAPRQKYVTSNKEPIEYIRENLDAVLMSVWTKEFESNGVSQKVVLSTYGHSYYYSQNIINKSLDLAVNAFNRYIKERDMGKEMRETLLVPYVDIVSMTYAQCNDKEVLELDEITKSSARYLGYYGSNGGVIVVTDMETETDMYYNYSEESKVNMQYFLIAHEFLHFLTKTYNLNLGDNDSQEKEVRIMERYVSEELNYFVTRPNDKEQ